MKCKEELPKDATWESIQDPVLLWTFLFARSLGCLGVQGTAVGGTVQAKGQIKQAKKKKEKKKAKPSHTLSH